MYELFGYFDHYCAYQSMGIFDTINAVYEVMEKEGCEWVACAYGDEDYRIYYNDELIERWY